MERAPPLAHFFHGRATPGTPRFVVSYRCTPVLGSIDPIAFFPLLLDSCNLLNFELKKNWNSGTVCNRSTTEVALIITLRASLPDRLSHLDRLIIITRAHTCGDLSVFKNHDRSSEAFHIMCLFTRFVQPRPAPPVPLVLLQPTWGRQIFKCSQTDSAMMQRTRRCFGQVENLRLWQATAKSRCTQFGLTVVSSWRSTTKRQSSFSPANCAKNHL
jgi:hypothetical protein